MKKESQFEIRKRSSLDLGFATEKFLLTLSVTGLGALSVLNLREESL